MACKDRPWAVNGDCAGAAIRRVNSSAIACIKGLPAGRQSKRTEQLWVEKHSDPRDPDACGDAHSEARREHLDGMGAQDAVVAAAVFGNGGLPVRGGLDHHHVAGWGKCARSARSMRRSQIF